MWRYHPTRKILLAVGKASTFISTLKTTALTRGAAKVTLCVCSGTNKGVPTFFAD